MIFYEIILLLLKVFMRYCIILLLIDIICSRALVELIFALTICIYSRSLNAVIHLLLHVLPFIEYPKSALMPDFLNLHVSSFCQKQLVLFKFIDHQIP